MELRDLIDSLSDANGYMITASVLDNKGNIVHELITDKFPLLDMLPSHAECKKLIVKYLEQLETDTETF